MLYLGSASSPAIRRAMGRGELGMMLTPRDRRRPLPGVTWAADNGCYGKGYPGHKLWFRWLMRHSPMARTCLFATAPDMVGNAARTLELSAPWLPRIRAVGYPAALVAQDGLEHLAVPWSTFDVLFLGGTTDWKLSPAARELVQDALAHGKRVHMGRVNSRKRLLLASDWGCHSADGTYLAFGPDLNLNRLRTWLEPA